MIEELGLDLYHLQDWMLSAQVGDKLIYILGIFAFLAWIVALLTKKVKLPTVVGYVFLGILLSIELVENLPFLTSEQKAWYGFIVREFDYLSQIALSFIAFTIGGELSVKIFKTLGRKITYIALLQCIGSFLLVTLGILALDQPLYLALLLGAIASATAPAATVMVLEEYEAKGRLTSMALAVTGFSDALALIIFSFVKPLAFVLYAGNGQISIFHSIVDPLVEIGGSIGLGLIIGYLSQHLIANTEEKQKKVLTLITTLITSLAISTFAGLSTLITSMAIGFAYKNFSRKNLGIADYLETFKIPLYALFFILAGAEFKFSGIASAGFLAIAFAYTLARMIGKIGGSWLGAWISGASDKVKKYLGFTLFPQSGVAIALAYTVRTELGSAEAGVLIFNVLLFTAALTEVFGPLATKYVIFQAGEAQKKES